MTPDGSFAFPIDNAAIRERARDMSWPHLRGLKHDRTRSRAQKVRENPCIEGGIQTCTAVLTHQSTKSEHLVFQDVEDVAPEQDHGDHQKQITCRGRAPGNGICRKGAGYDQDKHVVWRNMSCIPLGHDAHDQNKLQPSNGAAKADLPQAKFGRDPLWASRCGRSPAYQYVGASFFDRRLQMVLMFRNLGLCSRSYP